MDISLNKVKIAIDLDGTLIDISRRDFEVYSVVIKHLGGVPLEFEKYWSLRKVRTNIFLILELSKLEKKNYDIFLDMRHVLIESNQFLKFDSLFDSVKNVLNDLSKKFDCYIVTKRVSKVDTEKQIINLGIKDYFKSIIVVSDNKLNAFKSLDDLVLVIGDTENDIIPAKQLGISNIALTSGIRNEQYLRELNPTCICSSFKEILDEALLRNFFPC